MKDQDKEYLLFDTGTHKHYRKAGRVYRKAKQTGEVEKWNDKEQRWEGMSDILQRIAKDAIFQGEKS